MFVVTLIAWIVRCIARMLLSHIYITFAQYNCDVWMHVRFSIVLFHFFWAELCSALHVLWVVFYLFLRALFSFEKIIIRTLLVNAQWKANGWRRVNMKENCDNNNSNSSLKQRWRIIALWWYWNNSPRFYSRFYMNGMDRKEHVLTAHTHGPNCNMFLVSRIGFHCVFLFCWFYSFSNIVQIEWPRDYSQCYNWKNKHKHPRIQIINAVMILRPNSNNNSSSHKSLICHILIDWWHVDKSTDFVYHCLT